MGSVGGIRIFRADPMAHTFFATAEPPAELARIGVAYVRDPRDADIIFGTKPEHLRKFGRLKRRFAIWSHEPRQCILHQRRATVRGVRNVVDVMNTHTGSIYRDNYFHLWNHRSPVNFDERMGAFAAKPDRICMLATYRSINRKKKRNQWSGPLIMKGRNIDLNETRQELALELYKRGRCDIYGQNWPRGLQIAGDSREGDWITAKRDVLAHCAINIAMENTIVTHYVTEKIWDAIRDAALPVYHGEYNGIYQDFPRGSFIEAAEKEAEALADEILQMPHSERSDRYEACLRTYIPVIAENRWAASRAALLFRTAEFIEEVISRPPESSLDWKGFRKLVRGTIRAALRRPSPSSR